MLNQIAKTKSTRPTKDDSNFFESINPYTEKVLETYPYDSFANLVEKMQIADSAFMDWSQVELEDRLEPIKKFADILKKNKDKYSRSITTEMGKLYDQAKQEVDLCIAICDYCVETAPEFLADEEKDLDGGRALITYQPQGVILSIQPWNFPFYQAIRYLVPNIIAGNTTLLSHASSVWGSARIIESALRDAGLPEGVFQLIYPHSEDLEEIYACREIRGVTFTGSAETGAKIAEVAAKNLKKTVLELGGNDAYIITESADIGKAVKACVMGRLINNGQTCTAAKRFIVVDKVYREFRNQFVEMMKEVQMGDPMEKTTKLGPLVRKDQLEKLNNQVQESLDLGAKCLVGGHIAKRQGFFFEPTVLENLEAGMPAYDDELFGPVACLIHADNLDHAIEIANESQFGLGSGIFGSEDEVMEVAKRKIDAGMVNVNGYAAAKPHLPFGGVKDSGYGREHGRFGFHEFVNIKALQIFNN